MPLDILIARQFFADLFFGEHHLPSRIKKFGDGWCVIVTGELATTDANELTRLVLLAHARCIRVAVKPHRFKELKICVHARDPQSTEFSTQHPTLEEAVQRSARWLATHDYTINPRSTGTVEVDRDVPVILWDLKGQQVQRFDNQVRCAEWLSMTRAGVHQAIKRRTNVQNKYRITLCAD